jgi:hypothetical protein
MNPGGIVEETGKVATGIVDAMKNQPMVLALIVLNAIIIAGIYFAVVDGRRNQQEIFKMLISNAEKAQDLLAKCVIPGGRASNEDDDEIPLPRPRPLDDIHT